LGLILPAAPRRSNRKHYLASLCDTDTFLLFFLKRDCGRSHAVGVWVSDGSFTSCNREGGINSLRDVPLG